MIRLSFFVAFITPLLFGSMAFAQDSAALISALEKAQATVLTGMVNISEEKPNSNLGVMIQVAMGPDPLGNATFTGDLEVYIHGKAIASASVSELPQVLIFENGERQVIRQTYSKQNIDANDVAKLLKQSFCFSELIDEIKRAKRVRVNDIDQGKEFRVTIDGAYFEPAIEAPAEGMPPVPVMPFGESVLEGILTVQTSPSDEIKSLKFELQYNDPMAPIIQNALKGGGGVQLEMGDMKKSTVPGRKMIVDFNVNKSGSPKAEAFAREARMLLYK